MREKLQHFWVPAEHTAIVARICSEQGVPMRPYGMKKTPEVFGFRTLTSTAHVIFEILKYKSFIKERNMAKEVTINALLSLQRALRERRNELSNLKDQVARRSIYMTEPKKIEEPKYDVVKVDEKIVDINNALLDIDTKIKESNAITKVSVELDQAKLMSAIEPVPKSS